jgi:hypothetical protein
MDPSMLMGGGMPPMDPSMLMGGGMPPGMPPMDPNMSTGGGGSSGGPSLEEIKALIREELSSAGAASGKTTKAGKPDLNVMATDIYQIKKLLINLYRVLNIELPVSILDGPTRDPMTGLTQDTAEAGGEKQDNQTSSINPIEPIKPAFPTSPNSEKKSAHRLGNIGSDSHIKQQATSSDVARLIEKILKQKNF